MNGYDLIMKIQQRMQDPEFAQRFNSLAQELNSMPGLQQEVMKIAQMDSEKKRQKAIDKLPERAKKSVKEMLKIING